MPNAPHPITANGRTQSIQEWAAQTGLTVKTIYSRIHTLGWTPERAVTTKANPRFSRGGRPAKGTPRPVPTLRRDKRSWVAYCRWRYRGQENYRSFGQWGSIEAGEAYKQFSLDWVNGRYFGIPDTGSPDRVGLARLLSMWLTWVSGEYRKGGKETSEPYVCRAMAIIPAKHHGDRLVTEFTPDHVRDIRAKWIEAGLSRYTINGYLYRLTRCFEWGMGQSLVPSEVYYRLLAVERVRPGRGVPDRPKRTAANADDVAATLAKLLDNPRGNLIRDLVAVQRSTGMRPQHAIEMRLCDLDRSKADWVYTPPESGNKTAHLGKVTRFYLGPQVRAILTRYLDGCPNDGKVLAYLDHTGVRRSITRNAYGLAIRIACREAGVKRWSPHQLRHALATEVAEREQSLKMAAAAIGDTEETAARHYVHLDPQEVTRREIARKYG